VKNGLNAPAGVTISSAGINLGLNPTNPPANSFIHNGFAIGVLSGENNPLGTGGDSFRFAKINGVPMTEGLSNSSQTSTALTGEYDFFYRVYKMCPVSQSLACHPILDVIEKFTTSGQASQGVFLLNEGQASHGVGSTEIPTKPVISK
jgi:hypothetical protein